MTDHDSRTLPWQGEVWRALQGRIASVRLHHALLFAGPQGIGKRALAEVLAQALLCSGAGDVPCGTCKSCTLLRAGSHPDSLRVHPEEPGRQIRIAQVRDELMDFVMRTPSISARKVVLIEPAEAMNIPTANCLLKSLEEPSAGTHLLLVSDAPVRLLPTIRSRCEQVRLSPPPWAEALAWLEIRVGSAGAVDLLGAASGCPLRAVQFAQSGGLEPFDRVAEVMLRALDVTVSVPSLAGRCDALELRGVLAWMQIFLGDLSRWLADPSSVRLQRALPVYEALGSAVDPAHVARTLRQVATAAREAVSTANPNPQLALESLLVRWGRRAA
jgi:DNA polymerase III subunit delta'